MKTKRIPALLLAVLLLTGLLAGCGTTVVVVEGDKKPSSSAPAPEQSGQNDPTDVPDPTNDPVQPSGGEAVKTGLFVSTSLGSSKDASAEGDGVAQSDIVLIAVTVDADGVIDSIQARIGFDTEGKLTADPSTTFPSKNELGDAYGMRGASSIGKEWNEQAQGFSAYVTGKTLAEIAGLAVDEGGKATGTDLAATVTVGVGEFQELIEKAAQ